MPKLMEKPMVERKKILPLVMTLAKVIVLSPFFDMRTPLTHLSDRFEGIDVEYFISPDSKSSFVNSFNAGRALERIGEKNYEGLYETMALSAI